MKSFGWSHRFAMVNFLFEKIWLAQVDSNHRPRAYQARALTTWAMSQYVAFGSDICSAGEITSWWNPYGWNPHFVRVIFKDRLVEMMGFEPMTPCLQGRCSPSWATPPYIAFGSDICSAGEITSWWNRFAVIYCFAMLGFAFSVCKRSFKIEQRTQKTLLSRFDS